MTTAYTNQVDAFGRQVQWLVEIDLDRCTRFFGSGLCTATGGDGERCYYTWTTCKDPTNFNRGTKTWRFCLNDVPWDDSNYQVWPLLKSITPTPQEVKFDKLLVYPEHLELTFLCDWVPPPLESDKGLNYCNMARVGEFWRLLCARNPNYSGRAVRMYRGFHAPGFTLADFQQVGPTYRLKCISIERNEVKITLESPLVKLKEKVVPVETSDDNCLQEDITISSTSIKVHDAYEYPDPATLTRNHVYIQIEDERMRVSARTTATNTLTVDQRGALGTVAVAHTAADATTGKLDKKVKHVAFFGVDGESGLPSPTQVTEVIQDLLEWSGIAAADVDTTSFDAIRDNFYPRADCKVVLEKTEKISVRLETLRESRGLLVFMNESGKFACGMLAPAVMPTAVIDSRTQVVEASEVLVEDDETRCTRVLLLYYPSVETSGRNQEYLRGAMVVNAELEAPVMFNEVTDKIFKDPFIDPDEPPLQLRNLGRRFIARQAFGTRSIQFMLDVKHGTLWPGQAILYTTDIVLNPDGSDKTLLLIITARGEEGRSRIQYTGFDCEFSGRVAFIAPDDSVTDDYDTATAQERLYCYLGDSDNRVGANKELGYFKF